MEELNLKTNHTTPRPVSASRCPRSPSLPAVAFDKAVTLFAYAFPWRRLPRLDRGSLPRFIERDTCNLKRPRGGKSSFALFRF